MRRQMFEHGAWLWIVLSGVTVSAVVFAIWEMIQHNYFQDLDYHTLHYLYITRGIALAFFPGGLGCLHRRCPPPRLHRSVASIGNEMSVTKIRGTP